MIFSTKYGTVQIKLDEDVEDVEITLNGETITIAGLDEPLKVEVGEHNLKASAPGFETFTRSFRVKRNEKKVMEVTFTPKAEAEGTKPEAYVEQASGDQPVLLVAPFEAEPPSRRSRAGRSTLIQTSR